MARPDHETHTTDAEAAEQAETEETVSDTGGDSDPGASTGEAQARENRENESPA